jgi:repressor LexA
MLTLSQIKTYQFIKNFIKQYHHSPTAAEIAKGIGIQSRGVVHRYLKALAAAGRIELLPNRHRNILLCDNEHPNAIPLVGCIAAGKPIEAISQDESVDMLNLFTGPNRFGLKVKGDSMVDEGIMDGDIVICQQSETAKSGQIVVALIDNQQATLKRIRFEPSNNAIELIPANSNYQSATYPAERVQIQGIYVGLIRKTP